MRQASKLVYAVVLTALLSTATAKLNAQAQASMTAPSTQASPFVFGRVVGPDGKPVAGATVSAYLFKPDGSPNVYATETTDADGRFKLQPASNHGGILVQAEGFGLTVGAMPGAGETNPGVTRLSAATDLKVTVVGPDAKPAAGVQLLPISVQGSQASAMSPPTYAMVPKQLAEKLAQTTDASGRCVFRAMPQAMILMLDAADDRFARITYEQNIALPEQPLAEATIRLEQSASVAGKLVDPGGKPVTGASIHAQGTGRILGMGRGYGSAQTDADGNYTIRRLSAGDYSLTAQLDDDLSRQFAVPPIDQVRLMAGQTVPGQDLKAIRGGIIQGKVHVKETGQALADMYIGVQRSAGGGFAQARTDKDGTYRVRVVPGEQSLYFQSAVPQGLILPPVNVDRRVKVAADQTVTVDWELTVDKRPAASGRVVDSSGKPVGGAMILLESKARDPERYFMPGFLTDTDGKFVLHGVASGSTLRAHKGPMATASPVAVNESNRADITLTMLDDVYGSTVVNVQREDGTPLAGATLDLTEWSNHMGMGIANQTTATDGTCAFKNLYPDTRYTVSARLKGYGQGQATLKLESGKRTESPPIVLPKADSFVAGMVIDANGEPVPDIEVRMTGGRSEQQSAQTDALGRFRFESVVAGDTISVYTRGGNGFGRPERVPAGNESVVLTLTRTP